MTYFLKKKKWMAWVVLLTFLFTSFMPTNLLAGNSVAEAAISGSTTVAVGETITLNGERGSNHKWTQTPDNGGSVTFEDGTKSSTVKVKGQSAGTVTITHTYTSRRDSQSSETYNVTVTAAGAEAAQFYYLKTPTSDPASNDTNQWGPHIGNGTIDVDGATWKDDKNFHVQDNTRIKSWPTGFKDGVVPEGDVWNNIFNAFKESVEAKLHVTIDAEDVEAIILHPYKISKNNKTDPDYHVDCTVEIKSPNVYTATYYLWDR